MFVMSKCCLGWLYPGPFVRPEEKARALDNVTVNISKTIGWFIQVEDARFFSPLLRWHT